MKPANRLARFVALYSDSVLILHPLYDHRADLQVKYKSADTEYITALIKMGIEADFMLLFHYRPLLEEGIVGIGPHSFSLCEKCQKENIRGLKEIEKGASLIAKENLRNFKIQYQRDDFNLPSISFDGPEEFLAHPISVTLYKENTQYKKRDDQYWVTYLIRSGLSGILHPNCKSFSYLTDHTPDIAVLKKTTEQKFPEINASLLEGLSHNLPFIDNAPLSRLIEFRKKEGEAFRVYRDSLRLALKSVQNTTENISGEVFSDVVLPELNKIDNTIKNSRKILKRRLSEELIISVGSIGLGLFAGLVSPTFGACIGAVGGLRSVPGLVKDAASIFSEPLEIRNNSYYFLWKVREETRN
jgi:hypothetical protein